MDAGVSTEKSKMSVISQRDRDCMSCRVISGVGLIGAATYILIQARKFDKGALPMKIFGHSLGILGFARLLKLPPFNVPFNAKHEELGNTENSVSNDYLIKE